MNFKTIKRGVGRIYNITVKLPWEKYTKEAEEMLSKQDAVDLDAPAKEKQTKDLAYRLAVKDVDTGWDMIAPHLRAFQDSNIECDLIDMDENFAIYNVKAVIAPEDKPDNTSQKKENESFIERQQLFENKLAELGLTYK